MRRNLISFIIKKFLNQNKSTDRDLKHILMRLLMLNVHIGAMTDICIRTYPIGGGIVDFFALDWIAYFLFLVGVALVGASSKMRTQNTSLFKLMFCVAAADGQLTPSEIQLLQESSKKFGISESKFQEIAKELSDGKYSFAVPEDQKDRENQIKALVSMAKADGCVDNNELEIIKEVASKFGLGESFVDNLV